MVPVVEGSNPSAHPSESPTYRIGSCCAESVMFPLAAFGILPLLYLALIVYIVWQVVSALNQISRGVEDIAQTLRRMESKEPQPGSHI